MLNLNELNFDDAVDFYEQMQIDEILMREHDEQIKDFSIEWVSIVKWTENNETRLNEMIWVSN